MERQQTSQEHRQDQQARLVEEARKLPGVAEAIAAYQTYAPYVPPPQPPAAPAVIYGVGGNA